MARYTLQLRKIVKDINIFDFDYMFYTDDEKIKKNFENKLIQHYYFDEIGFETIGMFKNRLKEKLNYLMPYYKQLYDTEIASKDINFLLNKDLKETFERVSNGETTSRGNNDITDSYDNDNLESNLAQGNASLSLDDGSLTNVGKNRGKNISTSNNSSVDNTNQNERTTLTSQGNIGITSSAELLQKWRDVIINIDSQIIEECWDLFMQIY